jgi:hypothetical protein
MGVILSPHLTTGRPSGYDGGVVLLSGAIMNRESFLKPSAASPRLGDT